MMGGPNLPLWKTFGLLILLGSPQLGASYGNIGCLFKESLCVPDKEYCFDDYAFGKCLSLDKSTSYRHKLGVEELELLKKAVVTLNSLGFHWSDTYTQCRLQTLLFSMRLKVEIPSDYCDHKLGVDTSKGRDSKEGKVMDVNDLAAVKYEPNKADFANEIYYPPSFPSEGRFQYSPEDLEDFGAVPNVNFHKEMKPYADKLPYKKSNAKYPPRSPNPNYYPPFPYFPDFMDYDADFRYPPKPVVKPYRGVPMSNLNPYYQPRPIPAFSKPPPRFHSFDKEYNTPDSFRQGIETKDMESKILKAFSPPKNRGFTEGGIVYIPIRNTDFKLGDVDLPSDSDFDLLDFEDFLGFQRRERLDVKKPGPGFTVNSFAFQKDVQGGGLGHSPNMLLKSLNDNGEAMSHASRNKLKERNFQLPLDKKDIAPLDELERIDTNMAFVEVAQKFRISELNCLKKKIADLLSIPLDVLQEKYIKREEDRTIVFKVDRGRNPRRFNASEVARQLDKIKDQVKKDCKVEILSTGIGDESQIPIKLDLKHETDHELFVATLIMCGVFAALISAGAAYYMVRRNSVSRKKLHSLSSQGTEPSKDYQDLCRARMATKASQENVVPSVRVSKLSQESDSPSSRSSTSSWSEEPALSNMDISTGHMVLSYMEDHLKNKDRLDTEWTALCAYEAEPCSVAIAQLPDNSKKNRYVNALPYDHARVILNELANVSNSDYINASTITDHDPRNPAYIATQGPLASTAADMWQMVWEQGCVVIVILTRLTENDLEMSFRYWPEEGSELYHIYEVHLVSEHIWCDDYLVRSFYLKNLKTGETRTVTQFHFLSWPEGGTPISTKALLEFRRKVNKSFRGRSCPIVVHCSDGIGRTGTYCLLDMVLNRMAKGAKEIDIAATLEHIRDQRGGAVATKQQFQFVLQAVAEEVQAILRVLPQQQASAPPLVSPILPLQPPLTPQPVSSIAQTTPTVTTTQSLPQPKSETQQPPN
ncbi:hypothetical protein M8J75_013537 [Diaphorina citri]|nr:hypothetical protein M8J75_013537 [Diaphorina citri]